MAKGAYYQGLTYANRDVKPVDFGKISLGVAQVELDRRKKREAFLMEQQDKFAEFFTTDQLNAGLANPDAIGDELQARVLTDFNAINAAVEAKQMTYAQARALTNGLKGQLTGLKQSYDKMGDFVKTYTDTENKGYSMELAMQHLNNFMEGSRVEKEGDTYFIAKDDPESGTIRQPLSELPLLYEKREKVDLNNDVVKGIFDIDKKADKVFSGITEYNKFLTNKGELSDEQKAVVKSLMSQYDDRDLMDIADQFGFNPEISKNGFKLSNKQKVLDEILPEVLDLVKESYKLREYQEDSQTAILAGMKLKFSKTRDYGINKNAKYRLVPHANGNAIFNPNKDPKITRLQAIPVPEGTDAESIKSLFPTMQEQIGAATSTSGAITTSSFLNQIRPVDISDVTVRDFHITSDGKHMLVNGTYRPRVEKVRKRNDGVVTDKEMTFGEIEHGTFAVPINSIYARDVAQAIGLDPGHETAIFGNRSILDRISLENNRMTDY